MNEGISLPSALFLIFLILKLTDNIDWSWWWVISPFWIPWGIFLGLITIFMLIDKWR